MKIILLESDKRDRPCHYCGKSPSKYEVRIIGENTWYKTVCVCNMCALIHGERFIDI